MATFENLKPVDRLRALCRIWIDENWIEGKTATELGHWGRMAIPEYRKKSKHAMASLIGKIMDDFPDVKKTREAKKRTFDTQSALPREQVMPSLFGTMRPWETGALNEDWQYPPLEKALDV